MRNYLRPFKIIQQAAELELQCPDSQLGILYEDLAHKIMFPALVSWTLRSSIVQNSVRTN